MNIVVTNLQSAHPVPVNALKISLSKIHVKKLVKHELSIVFVSPQKMRSMNKKYLGHDYVTDVITFTHGEIVICPSVAKQNAKIYHQAYVKELLLYAVHGILHLAGYDDHTPRQIFLMRRMEKKLMESI